MDNDRLCSDTHLAQDAVDALGFGLVCREFPTRSREEWGGGSMLE